MKIMSYLDENEHGLSEVAQNVSSKKTALKQINEYLDLLKTNIAESQNTESVWKSIDSNGPN